MPSTFVAELDHQYSPSRWSPRLSADVIVDRHIDASTSASQRARSKYQCQLDVRYGTSDRQAYDVLYDTTTPTDAAIVVYIHGGYWQLLSKDISCYMAEPVVDAGAMFISVDYDLCPTVTVKEIVQQIQSAVDHIHQMALTRRSRGIILVGHSAGAHLAFMSLLSAKRNELIKGLVLISGVYDLRPLVKTSINDALNMTEEEAWSLSPMNKEVSALETCHDVHVVTAVAQHDSPAFRQQSLQFHQLLNVTSKEYVDVNGTDHFDVVERLQDADYVLNKVVKQIIQQISRPE